MIEETTTVINEYGIHMRPGMQLTDMANEFQSEVTIACRGKEANAKSIMDVTMLAVVCGDDVIIKADGEDEKEVVSVIIELIDDGFPIVARENNE